MTIICPYSGSSWLVWAKLVSWAGAYPQNSHRTGVCLPIYGHTLRMPKPGVGASQGRTGKLHNSRCEGQKENKEIMALKKSTPQFLSTLNFYWAARLTFKCTLLCLHCLKSLLFATLSALSSPSIRPPRKSFVGDPRTEPPTPTTQTPEGW